MPARQSTEKHQERILPLRHNPLLASDRTPDHEELVKKRRLGQTNLAVKPGQIGTSNATKPENLGIFDYAHLRAPLPKNLKGSEIFAPNQHQPHPEAYFLMRRSSDGYISATGMFKAAFPWAEHKEEIAERDYLKTLTTTSQDEVAGNVWIPEAFALQLAEEYDMVPWIRALVDEAPIPKNMDDPQKSISPPPKYIFSANDKPHLPPPAPRGSTPRARGRPRASSPGKPSTPAPKSPRKPRTTKASKESNAAHAREASASLQSALNDAASIADSESVDGEKVRVDVESTTRINGETESTTTKVQIEMPGGSAELPLPENPEEMIQKAKEMVEEARKLDGESSSTATKRKAEELDEEDDEDEDRLELQPVKKTKLLEQELKKEKVRKRALFGFAATLAIGAIIPYVI